MSNSSYFYWLDGAFGFIFTHGTTCEWRGEKRKNKRKRRRLKPQSPEDCELCQKGVHLTPKPGARQVTPWSEMKNPSGRKKRSNSEGKARPRKCCNYYGITDSRIHALVSNGWRGKEEPIRQWKCQACGCKFSERRNTPLYYLKTASKRVAEVMTALAEGVDLSAATRIFKFHHTTLSRWLGRSGQHSQQLHDYTFRDFVADHLQLDEMTTRVKQSSERVWLWTAVAAKRKVLGSCRKVSDG